MERHRVFALKKRLEERQSFVLHYAAMMRMAGQLEAGVAKQCPGGPYYFDPQHC